MTQPICIVCYMVIQKSIIVRKNQRMLRIKVNHQLYSSYDIRNTNCNNSRLWQDRIDLYFQTQDRIESFVFETLIYFKFLHLYNPFINGRPLAVTDRLKTFSIFHWVYMVSELLWLTSFFSISSSSSLASTINTATSSPTTFTTIHHLITIKFTHDNYLYGKHRLSFT